MLVAVDEGGSPIGWQWCHKENTAAYRALMRPLAPPGLLVCDGAPSYLRAAAQVWPVHGGATLPGAHAAQHVHRPDAQP